VVFTAMSFSVQSDRSTGGFETSGHGPVSRQQIITVAQGQLCSDVCESDKDSLVTEGSVI
jgi:hypothetical protein